MEKLKKIVFVGSRFNVLEHLLQLEDEHQILIYALEDSMLVDILQIKKIGYRTFGSGNKTEFVNELLNLDFDILLSNGCPFLLPVQKFSKRQRLINIHPTYLPFLRGKTPINGIFYNSYKFYGATMHFMDAGMDTGAIISQHKEVLSDDLDLGLLYYLSMKLEGTVFARGWQILKQSNFEYEGEKQLGESTLFNRSEEMQRLNFKLQDTSFLLRSIKSFGVLSQGCVAEISNTSYKIFDAEKIIHVPLLEEFKGNEAGSLLLEYDSKLLVKTRDGILKLTRFHSLNSNEVS